MKRIIAMALLLALAFSGCGSESSSTEEISAPEPTVTMLGRVSSISGNDVVLTLGTYGSAGGTQDSGAPTALAAGAAATEASGERGSRGSRSSASEGGGQAAPAGESAPTGGAAPEGAPAGEDAPAGEAPAGGDDAEGSGRGNTVKFKESGESWSGRIPVGTPITYGTLNVAFSQLQINYIVSLALGGPDGQTVVSGAILSTS